ncbi:uncharacterized protein N7459_001304 [Penicillium hispanicum]|uniref:uncharacterized protein n=1 Tax=Penicillium hispanicum TaxID=1080232 RepID=UPI002540DFE2|nr:uncharacterized protein N7459_001304 [Penicillium hispanicum]KAJ5595096.1 hypothetical protein N7459_001304 [Penicillium hispanicum]
MSEPPKSEEQQEPSPPPTKPSKSLPIRPASTRTRQTVTVQFSDVAAHTAKCDQCDKRNKDGMTRCLACGWQCCRRCLIDRGGDRTHRSFTSTHAPESETRTPALASSTKNASGATTIPSVESTSGTTEARQAAEALWSLGSGGPRSQSLEERSTTPARDNQNDREIETLSELESEDPDETLTMGSESEVENDMDVHEMVDYREVRRNPPRVARPTQLTE